MVFGIKKDEFEKGLNDLREKVVSYVTTILKPLSEELDRKTSDLENRLNRADAENTKLNDTVGKLNLQLTEYGDRLLELERAQKRTGIVSETTWQPKGEVTFEDVQGLAKEVSDTAYQRIRDYFLLEMAKKGYEGERPDFAIWDNDSSLGIQFSVTDEQQKPHAGWNSGREYKTQTYLENIPELKEGTARGRDKEKVMFSREGYVNNADWFLLRVSSNSKSDWAGRLREELPELLQAYMLGYSLKCLDKKKFDTALCVQEKHGLKNNSALLARMSEIMLSDPNLATKFVAHYSPENR